MMKLPRLFQPRSLWIGLISLICVITIQTTLLPIQAQQAPTSASPSPSASASPSPAASPTPEPSNSKEDLIEVGVTLTAVDPIKGEVEARLDFTPQGKYVSADGHRLAKKVLLTINNIDKAGSEIEFKAKKRMDSLIVKLTTLEGDANNYPFDTHTSEIWFSIDELGSTPDNSVPIPIKLNTYTNLPGFDIQLTPSKDQTDTYVVSDLKITRSATVKIFAIVIMLIMWILSLLALLLAIRVLKLQRVPETAMLGFLAALLFAFPAIRNVQPGVPPFGTWGDFLAFFWTETILVLAAMILGWCWLRRYGKA